MKRPDWKKRFKRARSYFLPRMVTSLIVVCFAKQNGFLFSMAKEYPVKLSALSVHRASVVEHVLGKYNVYFSIQSLILSLMGLTRLLDIAP